MLLKSVMFFSLMLLSRGSESSAPGDPELMQRSMAAVNMRRFEEDLLQDALASDAQHSLSKEQLLNILSTEAGQRRVRAAAMQAMSIAETSERGRGDGTSTLGWLDTMCDTMPWLAWLVSCSEPEQENREESQDNNSLTPFQLAIQNYQWATCNSENEL